MSNIIDMFGLDYEQSRLLFSMQYYLVTKDVEREKDTSVKTKKIQWHNAFRKNIENMLEINEAREFAGDNDFNLWNEYVLEGAANRIRKAAPTRTPMFLILLELVTFIPYYPLGESNDDQYKKLKVVSEDKQKQDTEILARFLNIEPTYVSKFLLAYKNAIKGIGGNEYKWIVLVAVIVFAAVAAFLAPTIAPLFAAKGLAGAAAISAGLAALGGGAIAAGGFGMAGGLAVIVGGGALLGGATGAAIRGFIAMSPDFSLSQAAKIEVVLKEIILAQQDTIKAQELIMEQRKVIYLLEDDIFKLKLQKAKNQDEIKKLKKSIGFLKKALNRNEEAVLT
ncbi:MAG: hypothetical protein HPY50_04115 [Firmicutes bacterium]|nr:hypothetical protein [Bacillota bacterium]